MSPAAPPAERAVFERTPPPFAAEAIAKIDRIVREARRETGDDVR
jgi:hypothetical protein